MKAVSLQTLALLFSAASVCGWATAHPTLESTTGGKPGAIDLPASLQPAFYQALARDAGPAYHLDGQGCATLSGQSLRACFKASGVQFSTEHAPALGLHLSAYGRGSELTGLASVSPRIDANTVNYEHGALTEWWKVLPIGFEQGFTLNERPAGEGELTLQLASSRAAVAAGDDLGWGALRYGKLVVTDADGDVLPASLRHVDERIVIAVDDRTATYPVIVDPLVWIEQKVVARDAVPGEEFGYSVALSGDTALIGAAKAAGAAGQQGAAYVFTRTGASWTEAARLSAADGANGDAFGYSVALEGDRALVGARAQNSNLGAAYVFEGSGSNWTQTAKLLANDGIAGDRFGTVVALSGDTALVSAATATVGANASQGAGYIFTFSGGNWSQSAKLVATDGVGNDQLGIGAALDGATAVLGTPNPGFFTGAAYVFTESGGNWSQTQKLTIPGTGPFTAFGGAVALEGQHLLIGANLAMGAQPSTGAAWMFTLTAGSWVQQQQLVATDGEPGANFGYAVALDGDTALVGADRAGGELGAVYLFEYDGSTWVQGNKLVASDASAQSGYGSGLARQGNTILVGAPGANAGYFYAGVQVAADPIAEITPIALDLSAVTHGSSSAQLSIANLGGSDLVYSIATADVAAGPAATSYKTSAARRASATSARPLVGWQRALDAGATNGFGAAVVLDEFSISQMTDNTPGDHGVSCGDEEVGSTAANSWWRRFYFDEHAQVGANADIRSVTVSAGSIAIAGGLPVTINLYTIAHATAVNTIPTAGLTLIGSGTGTFTQGLESLTIPVNGLIADTAGLDLVVELHTEGNASGGQWFPGANATAETHPTFLSAPECGLDEPATAASINFADFHLTMVVTLDDGAGGATCENPASVPWLQIPQPDGSVAPGLSGSVSLIADANGLAPGTHEANLCVTTNDPTQPIVAVPVSFVVSAPDALFCSGFEDGESGACGAPTIVTGSIDEDVTADGDGSTLDLLTGQWGSYDGTRVDDINLYDYGDGNLTIYLYGDTVQLPIGAVVDTNGGVAVLSSGTIVGPGSNISNVSAYMTNWLAGADGYIGLAFQNEQTGQLNYGYIHLTTTAPMGFPARVLDYAYDNSGAPIRIP